jgi:hypothetical protein
MKIPFVRFFTVTGLYLDNIICAAGVKMSELWVAGLEMILRFIEDQEIDLSNPKEDSFSK